jgi:hypothetical protein
MSLGLPPRGVSIDSDFCREYKQKHHFFPLYLNGFKKYTSQYILNQNPPAATRLPPPVRSAVTPLAQNQ